MYNQEAKDAYLDTGVNISVGKRAPNDYFSAAHNQCLNGVIPFGTITNEQESWGNLAVNCIPSEILNMTAGDYPDFCKNAEL